MTTMITTTTLFTYPTLLLLLLPIFLLLLSLVIWQRNKSSSSFSSSPSATSSSSPSLLHPNSSIIRRTSSKFVSDSDLKFLKDIFQEEDKDNHNPNPKWEHVIHKTNHLLSYSAKCSKPPKDGPLRYLSTTIFNDFASSELLRNFYLDTEYRKRWDNTLLDHHQLHLNDDNDASEAGVELGRTVKKFPLLKPREYVLAWKLWEDRDNNTFYCFIKECEHPSVPRQRKYVRVEFFRSGWRIRKVPGRNACEIMMFHQEDAGLNMDMAKLAFSKGIWNYVCKMDNALRRYSVADSHLSSAVTTSLNLMQKVPAWLDPITSDNISPPHPTTTTQVSDESQAQMTSSSRSSKKKLLAKSLLVLGGVICLSRGHSSLGAKVAMAYMLTKLNKRHAKPNQTDQS